jgi:hypothetical protein
MENLPFFIINNLPFFITNNLPFFITNKATVCVVLEFLHGVNEIHDLL